MRKIILALSIILVPFVAESTVLKVEQYDHQLVCVDSNAIEKLLYHTARAGRYLDNALRNIESVGSTQNSFVPLQFDNQEFSCQVGPFVPIPTSLQLKRITIESQSYWVMSGVAVGDPYRKRLYSISVGILLRIRQVKLRTRGSF